MITATCSPDGDAVLTASAPAETTEHGHREGRAPLPFVTFERGVEGELVVERGGFGGRPAYFRVEGDVVIASTDLAWVVAESVARGLDVGLAPDRVAAECLLDPGPAGRTQSLFRSIVEVAPATRVRLAARRAPAVVSLPVPAADHEGGSGASGADTVQRLRRLLFAAVERAAGVHAEHRRVAVLTGGGLDSGALLAMTHALGATTTAFAMDFAGPGGDRPHLAALARTLGLAPQRIMLASDDADADADAPPDAGARTQGTRDLLRRGAVGMPLTWPSATLEATLMTRALDWGASHALAGLGADGWFDGDPDAASLLVATSGLRAATSAARLHEGAGMRSALVRALWPMFRREVPWKLRRYARRRSRARVPSWLGPRGARVLRDAHERRLDERPWTETTTEQRIQRGFLDPHLAFASTLRLQLERLSGLGRVDPYLDAELATFVLSLSPEELLGKVDAPERRGLLREALRGLVPESLRTRRDKASFAPVHRALFRPSHRARVMEHARATRLADLGIVEPVAFRAALEHAFAAAKAERAHHPTAIDMRLHATLSVEAFLGRC